MWIKKRISCNRKMLRKVDLLIIKKYVSWFAIIPLMGNVIRAIGNGIHKVLDYISFNWCPERPTYRLATDNLHIPDEDMTVVMQIVNLIAKGLGLLIAPFQMLSDKKFTIHIYETTTVFVTPANPTPQNIVPTCEKMLMYIAQNRSKIIEPVSKQILKTVTLQNKDYDI